MTFIFPCIFLALEKILKDEKGKMTQRKEKEVK